MALGSIPLAEGILFGKTLDRLRSFVGRCCVFVSAGEEVLYIGCKAEILKKKTVF
jgi:hypothetical protein